MNFSQSVKEKIAAIKGYSPPCCLAIVLWFTIAMLCTLAYNENMYAGSPNCFWENRPDNTNTGKIVIWYHNVHYSNLASLRKILDSGIATHVMLASGYRFDFDYQKSEELISAISEVKNKHVQLIWTKPLWPVSEVKGVKSDVIYKPEYYMGEIKQLRHEAEQIGADSIGLDVEPYGNAPVKKLFNNKNDVGRIQMAVKLVMKSNYKVDFILPSGSTKPTSPYNYLSELGTYKISEDTYFFYKEDKWLKIQYSYDIAGIYLDTGGKKSSADIDEYFKGIFVKALSMDAAIGIFLYPKEDISEQVSDSILRICSQATKNFQ